MKKLFFISICIITIFLLSACSKNTTDPQSGSEKWQDNGKILVNKENAINIVMNQSEVRSIKEKGKEVEILNIVEATPEKPIWEISIGQGNSQTVYIYQIDAYTGKIEDMLLQHEHHEDIDALQSEMQETVQWVFENWQNFDYETYDPTKYGLAFSLNFRLPYIFDNYEENIKTVTAEQIISEVKVVEVKDIGMAENEEDETIYGQLRLITQYKQQIGGQEYVEPVEVLIFSKKHLDSDEGWQITNVDMYPTKESSEDFDQLFFGFKKS
ncbi:PepSY domain-containing protein [Clostridiaceae bacterium 35-E11]